MNFCDVELSGTEAVIVCNSICSEISGRKLSGYIMVAGLVSVSQWSLMLMWVIDGFVLRWSAVEEADVGICICAGETYIPYRRGSRKRWLIIFEKKYSRDIGGRCCQVVHRKDFELKF